MDQDEYWMREALQEAEKSFAKGEVPVGAVLVYRDQLIASNHNQVETLQDASSHAEMLCLREGARVLKNWRLSESILYSTLEPCLMCAGALTLFRVKTVVWGAPDLRHGAGGSLFKILGGPHPIHQVGVRGGVLEEESRGLLKRFFQEVRNGKNI